MHRRSLLLIALVAPVVVACHEGTTTRVYEWQGELPADAWVHVRDLNGGVRIGESPSDQIAVLAEIRGSTSAVRRARIERVEDGSDLVFCAMLASGGTCTAERYTTRARKGFPFGGSRHVEVRFTILVPDGVRVNASTVNGAVKVERAPSDVVVKTVNGRIDATVLAGGIEANSVNGSVHARVDSLPAGAKVALSTVNGSVHAELPESASGRVDLSTVNGSLTSDFALQSSTSTPRHLQGVLGDAAGAGGQLTLKTVNGSVRLARGS